MSDGRGVPVGSSAESLTGGSGRSAVAMSPERKSKEKKPSNRQEVLQSYRSSKNRLQNTGMAGFSRKSKKNQLKTLKKRRLQVAESAPEAHFLGEIVGGVGFEKGVTCKWMIEAGEGWEPLDGDFVGQTQCDYPFDEGDMCVWAHPIDVHYAMQSATSWPRIIVQIWKLDSHGQQELAGYGFGHLPTVPGCHEMEVSTWRPLGHTHEEINSFFLGGSDSLKKDSFDAIFTKAWVQRCHLQTVSSGTVMISIATVLKHFDKEDMQMTPTVDAMDRI
jgi:B9 domain-containing protein 2